MSNYGLLDALESFYRSLGYPVGKRERTLIVRGDVPFTIEITPDSAYLRVTALTDIEASLEDALKLAEMNFLRYGVKLCIDTEGFVAVVNEVPLRYIKEESPLSINENFVLPVLSLVKSLAKLGHR